MSAYICPNKDYCDKGPVVKRGLVFKFISFFKRDKRISLEERKANPICLILSYAVRVLSSCTNSQYVVFLPPLLLTKKWGFV